MELNASIGDGIVYGQRTADNGQRTTDNGTKRDHTEYRAMLPRRVVAGVHSREHECGVKPKIKSPTNRINAKGKKKKTGPHIFLCMGTAKARKIIK